MEKYARWATPVVQRALKNRRVLIISGARQVGKSTLTKQAIIEDATFRTLDSTKLLNVAFDDPTGFLTHNEKTLVIDEIQKAPHLLPEIKIVVDNNNSPGQFVLTGSADVMALPEVKESLAGRVKNLKLRGLTQGEIEAKQPNFVEKVLKKDLSSQIRGFSKKDVLQRALRGGYPEAIIKSEKERREWYKDYVISLLTHDLKDISNIKRHDELKKVLYTLSAWSSKYMDISGICSKCGLSKPTLNEYMGLIEKLYLCERVYPWTKSDYDRVGRTEKIFITDTGLMSSVLDWNYESTNLDADRYGKLIETFVFNELSAQVDLDIDLSLNHYRDREGREIDFIIENNQGDIIGVEVKGGSNINKDDFKHLKWFKENLAKDKRFIGIVLYSSEDTLPFGEDMLAVPTAALWS
ncbi:MAG: ATP-binding protein [Alphaproteobacteria bacterium]